MRGPAALVVALLLTTASAPARAWGDEGHEIIATVADALLTPSVRRKVHAILGADEDPLSDHDIAAEATWADHQRDANADGARSRTRQWHFVDTELANSSLDAGCFGHPRLAPGLPATEGPAHACLVDKIDQFGAELASPATTPEERLLALKYLLHFVGDLHQPLHASDDDDRGGNDKHVSASGFRAGNLHHYWDTEFVQALGADPQGVAADLLSHLSRADVRRWSAGTPTDWARDTFQLARAHAYGLLPPPNARGTYRLGADYIDTAIADCRQQLTIAGVRLAALLNQDLARPASMKRLLGQSAVE